MIEGMTREKSIRRFIIMWILLVAVTMIAYYDFMVDSYNTSILAFSYKYGFISRGFIGTIFQGIGHVFSINVNTYHAAIFFTQVATFLFFSFLLVFVCLLLYKIQDKYLTVCEYGIFFFTLFTVSTFISQRNFGRLDIYMISISLIASILLLYQKMEWFVIVLSALGVMVHQGYVFMYLNIILIILAYRFVHGDKKNRRKYSFLIVASFLVSSVLFLYFEFFSRMNGENYVEEIVRNASNLSLNGEYHRTLIDHEILGIDLSSVEWNFHKQNFLEMAFFVCLISPIGISFCGFLRSLIKGAEDRLSKWKYICLAIGALTILPNFILKIDYARWILAVFIYYLISIMVFIAMGDVYVGEKLIEWANEIKCKPVMQVMLIIPLVLLPLWDVFICESLKNIAEFINQCVVHLW